MTETADHRVHILLLSQAGRDLSALSRLLAEAAGDRVELELVSSPAQATIAMSRQRYDLLLYEGNPASVVQNALRTISSIDLQGQASTHAVQAAIQEATCTSGACDVGNCTQKRAKPCVAMLLLGVIDAYQKQRLREGSEELLAKLRHTVEQSADLVMITNAAAVIEYVNPAFERATGYSQSEVLGQAFGILKSEQQSGELYEEMWDTVLSGKVFHGVVMNRKKNGETFILEKSLTPLRNPDGQITHFVATGRDITDQRRLERQLQQAQKMDAIGKLAGGVAHDFNNLLMVISANAELTLDTLPAEDASRGRIEEMLNASHRAADLTRQLLAFGRQQVQSLRLLDLNAVISEISRMLPRLIGEHVQFAFVAGADLGMVKADPVQIEQIVMNLATNARDAMPQGGKLTIETANVQLDDAYVCRHAMVPPGDYVLVAVSDSGAGIAAEHLAHIFEPFFTTKEAAKGTGLGLATVYGIVKQSSGFIWVYSELGTGTTFKIYLPRVRHGRIADSVTTIKASPTGCETVLLVEDEEAVRHAAREFLSRSGYTVIEAGNGEEGLRASREFPGSIDLMITDVVMPRMSGPALAERLTAERPRMKVLFLSGYAENTVLRHGTIDVTAQFLAKPFDLRTLARKIRQVLDGESKAQTATA